MRLPPPLSPFAPSSRKLFGAYGVHPDLVRCKSREGLSLPVRIENVGPLFRIRGWTWRWGLNTCVALVLVGICRLRTCGWRQGARFGLGECLAREGLLVPRFRQGAGWFVWDMVLATTLGQTKVAITHLRRKALNCFSMAAILSIAACGAGAAFH